MSLHTLSLGHEELKREEHTPKLSLLFEKPHAVVLEIDNIKKLFDFLYRAYEMTLSQVRTPSTVKYFVKS